MNTAQIQQATPHYTNSQSTNLFNSFNYIQQNQLQVLQPMNLFNSFKNEQQSQFQVHPPPPFQPMNSFNLFNNEQHSQHQAQLTSNSRNISNVEQNKLHSSSTSEFFPSLSNIEGEENRTTAEIPDQSNSIEFSLLYFDNSRTDEILQKWNEDENEFEMKPSF